MDDDREPYEPLWAESLRREPRRSRRPAKLKRPSFPARPALALVAVVAVAVLLGALLTDHSGRVTFANLPSYWGASR